MSTPESGTSPRKGPSAEIEALLESAVPLAKLTCAQLCDEQANDEDILANLSDFPVQLRGRIRAAMLRDLASVRSQMKQQKCPPCA
jgi:hypothetical protein